VKTRIGGRRLRQPTTTLVSREEFAPSSLRDSVRSFSQGGTIHARVGRLQSWGGHKVTPNRVTLPGWTSKHWELVNGKSDHGRSLEEEKRQLEHLVASLSLREGRPTVGDRKERRLDLVP